MPRFCRLQRWDVFPFLIIYGLWLYYAASSTLSADKDDSASWVTTLSGLALVVLNVSGGGILLP